MPSLPVKVALLSEVLRAVLAMETPVKLPVGVPPQARRRLGDRERLLHARLSLSYFLVS